MPKAVNETTAADMTKALHGKQVERVTLEDDRADTYFIIHFSDGSVFRIRYDWLYEYEIVRHDGAT